MVSGGGSARHQKYAGRDGRLWPAEGRSRFIQAVGRGRRRSASRIQNYFSRRHGRRNAIEKDVLQPLWRRGVLRIRSGDRDVGRMDTAGKRITKRLLH